MKIYEARNREDLIQCYNMGQKAKYIFFWGHNSQKNFVDKTCLSQWYPSPFIKDNIQYITAEHFMMAEKARLFHDSEALNKILATKKPGAAKAFGRSVKGFNLKIWEKKRFDIVKEASFLKFSQNEKLRQFLMNTKKRILVEASPKDRIWGIGISEDHEDIENPVKWKGQNLLGFAIMDARDLLVKAEK